MIFSILEVVISSLDMEKKILRQNLFAEFFLVIKLSIGSPNDFHREGGRELYVTDGGVMEPNSSNLPMPTTPTPFTSLVAPRCIKESVHDHPPRRRGGQPAAEGLEEMCVWQEGERDRRSILFRVCQSSVQSHMYMCDSVFRLNELTS